MEIPTFLSTLVTSKNQIVSKMNQLLEKGNLLDPTSFSEVMKNLESAYKAIFDFGKIEVEQSRFDYNLVKKHVKEEKVSDEDFKKIKMFLNSIKEFNATAQGTVFKSESLRVLSAIVTSMLAQEPFDYLQYQKLIKLARKNLLNTRAGDDPSFSNGLKFFRSAMLNYGLAKISKGPEENIEKMLAHAKLNEISYQIYLSELLKIEELHFWGYTLPVEISLLSQLVHYSIYKKLKENFNNIAENKNLKQQLDPKLLKKIQEKIDIGETFWKFQFYLGIGQWLFLRNDYQKANEAFDTITELLKNVNQKVKEPLLSEIFLAKVLSSITKIMILLNECKTENKEIPVSELLTISTNIKNETKSIDADSFTKELAPFLTLTGQLTITLDGLGRNTETIAPDNLITALNNISTFTILNIETALNEFITKIKEDLFKIQGVKLLNAVQSSWPLLFMIFDEEKRKNVLYKLSALTNIIRWQVNYKLADKEPTKTNICKHRIWEYLSIKNATLFAKHWDDDLAKKLEDIIYAPFISAYNSEISFIWAVYHRFLKIAKKIALKINRKLKDALENKEKFTDLDLLEDLEKNLNKCKDVIDILLKEHNFVTQELGNYKKNYDELLSHIKSNYDLELHRCNAILHEIKAEIHSVNKEWSKAIKEYDLAATDFRNAAKATEQYAMILEKKKAEVLQFKDNLEMTAMFDLEQRRDAEKHITPKLKTEKQLKELFKQL